MTDANRFTVAREVLNAQIADWRDGLRPTDFAEILALTPDSAARRRG